jgi:hypothetical protein
LEKYKSYKEVAENLPDIEIIKSVQIASGKGVKIKDNGEKIEFITMERVVPNHSLHSGCNSAALHCRR